MSRKILVAMSGGVDSSVAAWLLKEQGADLAGAMMNLHEGVGTGGCCSLEGAKDAEAVARSLDIPFYVLNFTRYFVKDVIERFAEAYEKGCTPNPCIDCNRYLKFDRFLRRAMEIDTTAIATGHYAGIELCGGRYLLKKGVDSDKDQSYVLYVMTQEQLARTVFPLGGLTKAEVREIADKQGLVTAKKRESQDICFVPDGDYAAFIERHMGRNFEEGDFISLDGKYLGRHKGQARYTVGQRKGLGMGFGRPMYVAAKDAAANTVTLCEDAELYSRTLYARDVNWIAAGTPDGLRVRAKIRYRHSEQPARVWQAGPAAIRVEFDEAQRAITKGQAVVLYDGDVVLGGGTIE